MIYPPLDSHFVLPNIQLVNDHDESSSLYEWIQSEADVTLLIPGFVSCHGVCPRLAQLYKRILAEAGTQSENARKVSVLFFSFDPKDTPESLAMFREHMQLPDNWGIAQASPDSTQKLLSSLQFNVMKTEDGFQHPAQAFVFTKELRWIGSLYGTDVDTREFLKILGQASFYQEHPVLSSTLSYLESPNVIAVASGSGLLVGLALLIWLAIRFKPTTH